MDFRERTRVEEVPLSRARLQFAFVSNELTADLKSRLIFAKRFWSRRKRYNLPFDLVSGIYNVEFGLSS